MYTSMTASGDVLILPAAEFNNVTGSLASVKIQRSMIGTVYSTIKRTFNVTLKLHYNLERATLKELQIFLLTHSDELITLKDWAGRQYIGNLYNETFESTEEQGWSNTIDLLFEGRRFI